MAVTQSHFRFGIDSGTEASHGFYAAEDTNPPAGTIPLDTTFLLRFCLQCDATLQSNVAPQFQYRLNGGTYTNITTSSTVARAVTATAFADAANTTKRLSGTGTFESSSAGCTTDGLAGGAAMDIVASGNAETECSMQIRSADVVPGDLIEFRVVNTATPFTTYAVTPAFAVPLTPASNPSETSKLVEVLIVVLGAAIIAQPTEALKLRAEGGVDLVGLGNPVRVSETVTAELVGGSGDLSRLVAGESIKVSESLSLTLNPLQASLTEAVKVSEVVTPLLVQGVDLQESVRVVDIVQASLNPERATPSEALAVVDTPVVSITPIFSAPTESLKVVDSGEVELIRTEEELRVSDAALTIVITPELASASESIRIIDQDPTAALVSAGSLVASPSETLKLADVASVTLSPEEVAAALEALKVADQPTLATIDPEQATPSEAVKVADQLPTAALVESGTLVVNPSESLKVTDQLTLTLNPELTSATESVGVIDQPPTAAIVESGALVANPSESLKVVDQAQLLLDPEQAALAESTKVVDAVIVALQLAADLAEAPKVSDAVTVARGLDTFVSEGLSVADSPTAQLTALFAQPLESLKVVDETPTVGSGTTLFGTVSESLKVAEVRIVILDAEEASSTEGLRTTEVLAVALSPEQADVSDSLRVSDTVSATLTPLIAFASESLSVIDQLPRFGGPGVIDVVGSYVTSIEVTGESL